MNRRVKILKIFAAMPNQRPRERRPGFFGHFDGAGNEELVVRLHGQTSNIQPAFAKLGARQVMQHAASDHSARSNGMAQKATRGRARTPKAGAKRLHVAPIGFRTQCFWSAMSPRIAFPSL